MKVLTEKKPTLSIYTGVVDYPADTSKKVDREMATLRRELDESRAALRLQTARCRQLVAAYSARLKAGNDLRDHQLTLVLRALVALEARLRREQKAIRCQLAQRDAIIHQQQVEISRLRGAHAPAASTAAPAPHAAARATPATPSQLIVENHTCGQDSACDWRGHETVVDAMSHLRHQEAALRVLELVGPAVGAGGVPANSATRLPPSAATVLPLLNGETACIVEPPADFIEDNMAVTPPPDVVASYNDMNRECLELASMAASLRTGDKDKAVCFQDNPVLECVNLILLRDQEDFHEERRGRNRERGPESARSRRGRRSVEESPPPPPSSEPPAWYNSNGSPKEALKDAAREAASPRRPTPPALPPKPPRLVAQQRPSRGAKSPTPTKDATDDDACPAPPTTPPPALPGTTSPTTPSPVPTSPTTTPTSAPATPTDPEECSDALRRNFEEFNLDDCEIEGLGEGDASPAEVEAVAKPEVNGDGRPRLEGDGAESLKLNGHGLVLGQAHDVQDVLLTAPAEAPTPLSAVSANGLGVNLGPALAGTLAHQLAQLAPLAPNSLANYDTFLEATGLSNKSILTPSRMLSNHRSVLKPKDVKHRSRVKAGERCAGPCATGPTVKYWTEPFL